MNLFTRRALAATLTLVTAFACVPDSHAQSYTLLPIDGYLATVDGTPVDGTRSLTVSIYSDETGGTALYTETQSVSFTNGYFSVHVGDVVPVRPTLFFQSDFTWMGVAVDADSELPRVLLGAVPYAVVAVEAGYASSAGDANTAGTATLLQGLGPQAFQRVVTGFCGLSEAIGFIQPDGTVGCRATGAGSSCPSGEVMTGLDSMGSPTCTPLVGGSCLPGQGMVGINANGSPMCAAAVQSVTSTFGLTVGTSNGVVTINANGSLQQRIGTTCPAGEAMYGVAVDGSPQCRPTVPTNSVGPLQVALPSGQAHAAIASLPGSAGTVYAMDSASYMTTATMTCLVIATGQAYRNTGVGTPGDAAQITVAADVGNGNESFGFSVAAVELGGGYSTAATASATVNVPAGTYRFGCGVNQAGAFAGVSAACDVSWLCQ